MTNRTARKIPWIIVGALVLGSMANQTWLTAEVLLTETPPDVLWLHEIEMEDGR